jgi:hypothetical protein
MGEITLVRANWIWQPTRVLECLTFNAAEDDVMTPDLERESNRRLKAFGLGFVDGIGSVGNLAVLSRKSSGIRRRLLLNVSRRNWRTDKTMIYRDFQLALGKLNERAEEK